VLKTATAEHEPAASAAPHPKSTHHATKVA
jgi:hypothetical protein